MSLKLKLFKPRISKRKKKLLKDYEEGKILKIQSRREGENVK